MFDKLRVAVNVLKMQALKRGIRRSIAPVEEARFDSVLETYARNHDVVFVHAGLSDVRKAFDRDPYDFLLDRLTDSFESVLVPGFTTSFTESGVYHKRHSIPEFGTFARLFLADAEYRTNDAVHSILVKGPYRFDDCDHDDTFGTDGCWAKLDGEDVLYLNVGTDWIRSTQFHYLEQRCEVPYVDQTSYDGVIYYDDVKFEQVTQVNHADAITREFNRPKLERVLRDRDVLDRYDLNGLTLRFFGAGALRNALEDEVRRDPYYLIA